MLSSEREEERELEMGKWNKKSGRVAAALSRPPASGPVPESHFDAAACMTCAPESTLGVMQRQASHLSFTAVNSCTFRVTYALFKSMNLASQHTHKSPLERGRRWTHFSVAAPTPSARPLAKSKQSATELCKGSHTSMTFDQKSAWTSLEMRSTEVWCKGSAKADGPLTSFRGSCEHEVEQSLIDPASCAAG